MLRITRFLDRFQWQTYKGRFTIGLTIDYGKCTTCSAYVSIIYINLGWFSVVIWADLFDSESADHSHTYHMEVG